MNLQPIIDANPGATITITLTFPSLASPVIEGTFSSEDQEEGQEEEKPALDTRKSAHRLALEEFFASDKNSFFLKTDATRTAVYQAMTKTSGGIVWARLISSDDGFLVRRLRGVSKSLHKETVTVSRRSQSASINA